MIICLPNKNGQYRRVRIPQYILDIIANVKPEPLPDTYILIGNNPRRPGYGIKADLEKLGRWVKRYHSDFIIKRIYGHTRNGYFIPTSAIFEMTDPVVHRLEIVGLL